MTTHRDESNSRSRGFASMEKDKQREIASKGGHASHGGTSSNSSSEHKMRGGSSEQHANAGRQSHKNKD